MHVKLDIVIPRVFHGDDNDRKNSSSNSVEICNLPIVVWHMNLAGDLRQGLVDGGYANELISKSTLLFKQRMKSFF